MILSRTLFCLFAIVCCAQAQFETAVVLGTVRDASQSMISGANVSLSNLDTGITAKAATDANGASKLASVVPRPHTCSGSAMLDANVAVAWPVDWPAAT